LTQGEVVNLDIERDLHVELDSEGDVTRYEIDPKAMIVARNQENQIAPLDRQFMSKSVGQRMMTIFGGPLMNFILALVLFTVYVFMLGVPVEGTGKLVIADVIEGSPAAE